MDTAQDMFDGLEAGHHRALPDQLLDTKGSCAERSPEARKDARE
tara:strand:+ start:1441 stop:1572 length:132 start_codon:yes stop_codon:yes gene_type:complete